MFVQKVGIDLCLDLIDLGRHMPMLPFVFLLVKVLVGVSSVASPLPSPFLVRPQ